MSFYESRRTLLERLATFPLDVLTSALLGLPLSFLLALGGGLVPGKMIAACRLAARREIDLCGLYLARRKAWDRLGAALLTLVCCICLSREVSHWFILPAVSAWCMLLLHVASLCLYSSYPQGE